MRESDRRVDFPGVNRNVDVALCLGNLKVKRKGEWKKEAMSF